jgi:hypothetical protein
MNLEGLLNLQEDYNSAINEYIITPKEMIDISLEEGLIDENEASIAKLELFSSMLVNEVVNYDPSNPLRVSWDATKGNEGLQGVKDIFLETEKAIPVMNIKDKSYNFARVFEELPSADEEKIELMLKKASKMEMDKDSYLIHKKLFPGATLPPMNEPGSIIEIAPNPKPELSNGIINSLMKITTVSPETMAAIKANPLAFFSNLSTMPQAKSLLAKLLPGGEKGQLFSFAKAAGLKLSSLPENLQAGVAFGGLLLGLFATVGIFKKIRSWWKNRKAAKQNTAIMAGEATEEDIDKARNRMYQFENENDKKAYLFFAHNVIRKQYDLFEGNKIFSKIADSELLNEALDYKVRNAGK